MSAKPFLVDPSLYDINHPIALLEDIRKYNRQRYEMEMLTGILYEDEDEKCSVGYKQVSSDDFWVRGHMPSFPLMPGVVMCETAAQLASYFVGRYDLFNNAVMGFAGLDDVKFRGIVRPGDLFIVQVKLLKWRRFLITASFQAIVNDNVVCEGVLKGCPLDFEG